jgi:transcriptional regulator with XRE-family HTH domain
LDWCPIRNTSSMAQADRMDERVVLRQRFGARLKALRLERGWSVDEVCLRIECSKGYYYKLERGEKDFSLEMLARLAQAFRLDEVDFFTFPEASPLRHGIYELLRTAPEPTLLRTKLFLLEDLERSASRASAVNGDAPQPARQRKPAVR